MEIILCHFVFRLEYCLFCGLFWIFCQMMNGDYREIQPLCVLDFYVHESCQRQGIGFELFAFMLESEEESPHNLGYDRPSPKLLSFLRKQFNLASYAQQANNFVVFNQYFDSKSMGGKKIFSVSCCNLL